MTDIAFYHLQHSPLERVLPKLLDRTLGAGKRALVRVGSRARAEALSAHLWAFDAASWLPHGTPGDGFEGDQPVWLTDQDENPNGADFLFLADGAEAEDIGAFERCFELFDGTDETALAAARLRWGDYKAAGHTLTYWQQTDQGKWEEKKS